MYFTPRCPLEESHDTLYEAEFPASCYSWFEIVTVCIQFVPDLQGWEHLLLEVSPHLYWWWGR